MKLENIQDEAWSALRKAIINNDLDKIASILSLKSITQDYLAKALWIASSSNYFQAVQLLIQAGADINYTLGDGSTALTEAINAGQTEVIRGLLALGADTSIPVCGEVPPPLILAAGRGNLEIVKLLIEAGADVNQIAQSSGAYALEEAAGEGYEDIFNYLAPLTCLQLREEAKKILPLGIREREREKNVDPLVKKLSDAVFHGSLDEVQEVLKKDVNINGFNEYGCTALFWAVSALNMDKFSRVRLLLEAGANPNLGDEDTNETPLMRARHDEIFILLISAGADVNAKNNEGMTVLMIIIRYWQELSKLKMLIQAGADVNAVDNRGNTALSLARDAGHTKIVQLLIDAGAKED